MIWVELRYLVGRVVRHPPAPFRAMVLMLALLTYGTTGFLYFELPDNPALTWPDGIWYSVVTVTTVGYGDLSPSTLGGRYLVAVPVMFFGIGLLGYVLSVAASALVEAKAKELHGMGSFRFKHHVVVFNFADVGKIERILDELARDPDFSRDRQIVLVDEDLSELPAALRDRGVHFIRGNPTRDESLGRANVEHASHAIVLSKYPGDARSDSLSVTITLAIEARSSAVVTIVECVDASAQELLRKAGCDSIVCASRFDAHFLSHEILNPGVQEVVEELTTNQRGQQLYLTPCAVSGSYATLVDRWRARGHLVIGLRRGHDTILNPDADFRLDSGDVIVSIGIDRLPARGAEDRP